jgi:DNA invertase Pin-like site-specific DNA recombinase
LYARHSPGRSQTIEAQLADLEGVVQEKGWIIDRKFIDRWETGTLVENRVNFGQMLHLAKQGPQTAEVIMIVDLSRFSRHQIHAQLYRAQLRKDGWKILSLHDNIPGDITLAPIFEAMIDWKNEQFIRDLKEKTNAGLRYLAEQGCLPGGSVAKGYRLLEKTIGFYSNGDPRIGRKPDPNEVAELVRKAFEMKAQ